MLMIYRSFLYELSLINKGGGNTLSHLGNCIYNSEEDKEHFT